MPFINAVNKECNQTKYSLLLLTFGNLRRVINQMRRKDFGSGARWEFSPPPKPPFSLYFLLIFPLIPATAATMAVCKRKMQIEIFFSYIVTQQQLTFLSPRSFTIVAFSSSSVKIPFKCLFFKIKYVHPVKSTPDNRDKPPGQLSMLPGKLVTARIALMPLIM